MSNKYSDSTSAAPRAPVSPFSSNFSVSTEVTSDEPPDLGAFNSVFRALSALQPPNVSVAVNRNADPTHNQVLGYESDGVHSTVWNHDPIRSYLSSDEDDLGHLVGSSHSDEEPTSDTEEEKHLHIEENEPEDSPSLGALDSALFFLANERAKLAAPKQPNVADPPHAGSAQKTVWHSSAVSPRRKRRRKRRALKAGMAGVTTLVPTPDLSYSSAELSSSPDRRHHINRVPGLLRLSHSRSTPNLLAQSIPEDAHFVHLRKLAARLANDFPENAQNLSKLPKLSVDDSTGDTFIDTRGMSSNVANARRPPIVHVFVDHSNILIGFLSFLKRASTVRSRKSSGGGKPHISHAALAMVLERGRLVSRRVMAASSPLYQPVDSAEQLGYEVRVFARVPDTGDGMDRLSRVRRPAAPAIDSDPGMNNRVSRNMTTHSRTSSSSAAGPGPSPPGVQQQILNQSSGRVRYREQGVDELLQLKLHQAIVDVDHPPTGSTIVLATGDGNIGQFNEEGFLGCVRTALKKGWKVELYAWEEGLSRAWAREFSDGEHKQRFRIIGLEKYGQELLSPL